MSKKIESEYSISELLAEEVLDIDDTYSEEWNDLWEYKHEEDKDSSLYQEYCDMIYTKASRELWFISWEDWYKDRIPLEETLGDENTLPKSCKPKSKLDTNNPDIY